MQQLQPGTLLQGGKYRIVRVLGQGGFGITYLAHNTMFDVDVAVKEFFMKDENERNGLTVTMPTNATKRALFNSQKEKFKKEARRMFVIKNEHVVSVHDLFEENGTAYYVMDFIEGKSLKQQMEDQRRPFREDEAKAYLLQILDALQTIHQKEIFHMDLKPANIMVDNDGVVRLIDFGASKQLSAEGGFTTSTAYCYTPGYAPKEQVYQKSDQIGPCTDFYALGATLYKMMTGIDPSKIDVEEDEEEAFSFGSSISPQMQKLVIWMMMPQRKKRPQSVSEIWDRINKANKKPETKPIEETKKKENDATVIEQSPQQFPAIIQNLINNMVHVEGGTFMMGRKTKWFEISDEKEHQVTLSSYSIGKYEVTQEEWQAVMGSNPSKFKGSKRPVEQVSWDDCQEFIRKLNAMTGKEFRLPTEAEWEYAARGGIKSRGYKYAGSNNIEDVAWYDDNANSETHDVGGKQPNELGLYDMSGNVMEWCQDWYSNSYYSSSVQANPKGPASGSYRVYRGGSWFNTRFCRVANRRNGTPDSRDFYIGLRLALQ